MKTKVLAFRINVPAISQEPVTGGGAAPTNVASTRAGRSLFQVPHVSTRRVNKLPPVSRSVNGTIFLKQNMTRMADLCRELVDDGSSRKPRLRDGETWLIDQIDQMKDRHYVTQGGGEYVHTHDRDTSDIYTRWPEFSGNAAMEARRTRGRFPDLRIAVPGYEGREVDGAHRKQLFGEASAIVLAEGDLHAPHQIIEALQYLRAIGKAPHERYTRQKPLIVPLPVLDFYAPLFRELFGSPPVGVAPREFFRKELTKYIRTGRRSDPNAPVLFPESLDKVSSADIKKVAGVVNAAPPPPPRQEIVIPQIYVGTTKEEKLGHWRAVIEGKNVDVHTLMESADILGDPAEQEKTYLGNARGSVETETAAAESRTGPATMGEFLASLLPKRSAKAPVAEASAEPRKNTGKAESYLRTLTQVLKGEHESLSKEEFLSRLANFGVDASQGDKLYFMSDDRGLEFGDWSKIEPYFDETTRDAAREMIKDKVGGRNTGMQRVPGVETTWWINAAGGVQSLMSHYLDACDAYERAYPNNPPLSRDVVSVVATSVVEMDLNDPDKSKVHGNFSGATTYACRRPLEGEPAGTTECWYVPKEGNEGGHTIRQHLDKVEGVPDFSEMLPWFKTGLAMREAGIVFENTRPKNRVHDYRIDFIGSGGGEGRPVAGADTKAEVKNFVVQRLSTDASKKAGASPAAAKSSDVRALPRLYGDMFKSCPFDPYDILDRIDGSDAIVFDSVPKDMMGMSKLFYEFFSVLVYKNLHPDYKNLHVAVNENDPQLKILMHLPETHFKHSLGSELSTMAQPYAKKSEVAEAMKQHWNNYERIRTPLPAEPEVKFDAAAATEAFLAKNPEVKARRGDKKWKSLSVFGSGKAQPPHLVAEANAIAKWTLRRGLDLCTGGGKKGMMGAVADAYRAGVDESQSGGLVTGISTDEVVGKETDTGKLSEKQVNIPHISRNIVSRMKELFESEFIALLAGGPGTAQEFGFGVGLKVAGHPFMDGKPVIQVNSLVSDGRSTERLADDCLEFYGYPAAPEGTRAQRIEAGRAAMLKLGVHFIDPQPGDDIDALVASELDRITGSMAERVTG